MSSPQEFVAAGFYLDFKTHEVPWLSTDVIIIRNVKGRILSYFSQELNLEVHWVMRKVTIVGCRNPQSKANIVEIKARLIGIK